MMTMNDDIQKMISDTKARIDILRLTDNELYERLAMCASLVSSRADPIVAGALADIVMMLISRIDEAKSGGKNAH